METSTTTQQLPDKINHYTANKSPSNIIGIMTQSPDPFEHKTTIVFKLEEESCVSLVVYSPQATGMIYLVCGVYPKGYHNAVFNATDLPSGLYIARLRTNQGVFKTFMTKL